MLKFVLSSAPVRTIPDSSTSLRSTTPPPGRSAWGFLFPKRPATAPSSLIALIIATALIPLHAITVTNTADSGAGSLRQAISDANAGDTIDFDASLNGQSIVLTGTALSITKDLTIDASSLAGGIIIDADATAANRRAVSISNGRTVQLDTVTITGGSTTSSGGGISNDGNLTLTDCTIRDCSSNTRGGGISSTGSLTVIRCTLYNNTAGDIGGAIVNNSDPLTLVNSTITQNQAVNSGGGIFNFSDSDIESCTITENTATEGGGLYTQNGVATFKNTIIAGNTRTGLVGADIMLRTGSVARVDNNVIGDNSTVDGVFPAGKPNINGDFVGTSFAPVIAGLAPLADNAGPTLTMALLAGSPASDNGGPTALLTDQRGFDRNLVSAPDIGSVEAGISDLNLDGLTIHARVPPALSGAGVVFEISRDPDFLPFAEIYAGTGGTTSINGPRLDAEFNTPSGVTQDSDGFFYIADTGNNLIRRISPLGTVDTIAGTGAFGFQNGPGSAATFALPVSVAVGPDDQIYVVDALNHAVRKLTRPPLPGLPWTVTTLAGNGVAGFINARGTAARFNQPYGLTFDDAGNAYVADSGNHAIRKINLNGGVSTHAGTGSPGSADGIASAASFNGPYGVAFDSLGNLYVADRNNHSIRAIGTGGVVSTVAGSGAGFTDGTGATAQFDNPTALAVDEYDNLYVTDQNNHAIRRVTTPGAVVSTIAGLGTPGITEGTPAVAQFDSPSSICVNLDGNLILTDTDNHVIRRILIRPLTVTAVVDGDYVSAVLNVQALGLKENETYYFRWRSLFDQSTGPLGQSFFLIAPPVLATDDADPVTPTTARLNALVDPNGSATTIVFDYSTTPDLAGPDRISTFANGLIEPRGVAVDSSGNLFVADRGAHKIIRITPLGAMSDFAGSGVAGFTNATGSSAQFDHPAGLAIDGSDNLFVADELNHCIRKITPTGVVTTFAGSGIAGFDDAPIATNGKFLFPSGVAVDTAGSNVYVADLGNHRIRRISGGALSTHAGTGTGGFQNGTAASAEFNSPADVAIDGSGDVLVADRDNHRIRRIRAGSVTTAAGTGSEGFADGTTSNAQFSSPVGLTVSGTGSIYVADSANHRLRIIEGTDVRTAAGSGVDEILDSPDATFFYPPTYAGFSSPAQVAIDPASGNLFVTESGGDGIRLIERLPSLSVTVPQTPDDDMEVLAGVPVPETLLPGTTYFFRAQASNGRNPNEPVVAEILSFTTPTSPKIQVFYGPDTDSTPLVSGQLPPIDLGVTPLGTPVVHELTMTNLGEWDLDVTNFTVISAGHSGVIPSGGIDTIPEGETLTFEATVQATFGGQFTRTMLIESTDPETPVFEVNFTWIVVDPPAVATLDATDITANGATLNASVNPKYGDTSLFIEYSTDPNIDGREVTTLAGATSDYAEGNGTSALFNQPCGIVNDAAGNIYIADELNHRIRKIAPDGTSSTLAGTGSAGFADGNAASAQFSSPKDLAIATDGTIFVADSGNHRIRAISPAGVVSTYAGLGSPGFTDGVNTAARFSSPVGIAIDSAGQLFVADAGNHRVRTIGLDQMVSTLAGTGAAGSLNGPGSTAEFGSLVAITARPDGTLFVCETGIDGIRKITQTGDVSEHVAPGSALQAPVGLEIGPDDSLFVADQLAHRIWQVNESGAISLVAGSGAPGSKEGPSGTASFNQPCAVSLMANGDLIVGESVNSTLRVISSTTITIEVASGLSGNLVLPQSAAITGLTIDQNYFFRAFATNSAGTAYGIIRNFRTEETTPFMAWQLVHFGANANNLLIAGPDADPSGDGMSNLLKYALNLDPNANSKAGLPTLGTGSGVITLTYNQSLEATDAIYTVEWSDNLENWYTSGITEQTVSTGAEVREILASLPTGSDPVKFLRLKVTLSN